MNHALQKKVYMDEATGLPNKNKCEELLSAPKMITMPVGVCSFDLNNLRRINNSMGHEKGDAYIRIFAELVREAVPAHYFVGRAGATNSSPLWTVRTRKKCSGAYSSSATVWTRTMRRTPIFR